jgi:hypothetical protein
MSKKKRKNTFESFSDFVSLSQDLNKTFFNEGNASRAFELLELHEINDLKKILKLIRLEITTFA